MKKVKKIKIGNIREELQDKAHELWKEYCKKRDRVCQLCGSTNVLQVHHIFPRGKKNLFIDIGNGVLLCRNCHCGVTNDKTHEETLRRKIDKDVYDRLYEQSKFKGAYLPWKNVIWLTEQIEYLQQALSTKEEKSV